MGVRFLNPIHCTDSPPNCFTKEAETLREQVNSRPCDDEKRSEGKTYYSGKEGGYGDARSFPGTQTRLSSVDEDNEIEAITPSRHNMSSNRIPQWLS